MVVDGQSQSTMGIQSVDIDVITRLTTSKSSHRNIGNACFVRNPHTSHRVLYVQHHLLSHTYGGRADQKQHNAFNRRRTCGIHVHTWITFKSHAELSWGIIAHLTTSNNDNSTSYIAACTCPTKIYAWSCVHFSNFADVNSAHPVG